MVAAVAGLLTPAAVYLVVASRGGTEGRAGWANPAATDIAFVLAVLAVLGSRPPMVTRSDPDQDPYPGRSGRYLDAVAP